MTKRDLAILISRVLAVLALFNGIPALFNFLCNLPMIAMNLRPFTSLSTVLPFLTHSFMAAFYLSIAYFFWFHAAYIAFWFTKDMENGVVAEPQRAFEWQVLLIAALGLFLLGACGSDAYRLITLSWSYNNLQTKTETKWLIHFYITMSAFRLILGLFLVFRCRAITAWILGNAKSYPLPSEKKTQEVKDSDF